MYSNLLLTSASAILFTDDLQSAVLFRASDHLNYFRTEFEKLADNMPKLMNFFSDSLSFMDFVNSVFTGRPRDGEEFHYMSVPCLIPVLTKEMMQKHILYEPGRQLQTAI